MKIVARRGNVVKRWMKSPCKLRLRSLSPSLKGVLCPQQWVLWLAKEVELPAALGFGSSKSMMPYRDNWIS